MDTEFACACRWYEYLLGLGSFRAIMLSYQMHAYFCGFTYQAYSILISCYWVTEAATNKYSCIAPIVIWFHYRSRIRNRWWLCFSNSVFLLVDSEAGRMMSFLLLLLRPFSEEIREMLEMWECWGWITKWDRAQWPSGVSGYSWPEVKVRPAAGRNLYIGKEAQRNRSEIRRIQWLSTDKGFGDQSVWKKKTGSYSYQSISPLHLLIISF